MSTKTTKDKVLDMYFKRYCLCFVGYTF